MTKELLNEIENDYWNEKADPIDMTEVFDLASKALEQQPETGEWIELEVCNCHATLKCSVCDRIINPTFTYGEYSYEDIKEWYPFCHCGADMRGENNG